MSFYDDASLVFLPSGGAGKDGKAYSMKPTNGNGDFTFSRGSNLTATRVDSNGLIEKGRENLLLQSNSFDTTWSSANASVTSGQSGYDGSNDAWLLENTANSGRIFQSISTSGVNTFSVYVKAGTTDWVALYGQTSPNQPYVYFDLTNGVVGAKEDYVIDSTITSVGSGWYRIAIVFNLSVTDLRIFPAAANASLGVTGDNIYIQDAQVEQGLVATEYIESGATTGKAGILEDSPRFDYSGGASCPSLLLEPSRTNLIPHSEYHSADTYSNNFVSVSDNQAISPQGVQNAAKIILDSGTNSINGGHYYVYTSTSSEKYTISVFAKAAGYRYFTFTYGSTNAAGGHFDLQEGVKLGDITNAQYTNTSASIEDYGNGWYRLIVSVTDTSSAGRYLSMRPSPSASVPSNNNYSSTGDGTSGAYIYGLQLEEGSYPTSYIPNHSGGTAPRNGEKQEITGLTSSVLNQNDGSFYLELQTLSTDAGRVVITSYPTGASNDTMRFIFDSNVQFGLVSASSLTNSTNPSSDKVKVVGTYSGTELKLCVNGGTIQKSSGNFSFANQPTKIHTHAFVDTIRLFANIDKIIYFPTALSDADCIALTS